MIAIPILRMDFSRPSIALDNIAAYFCTFAAALFASVNPTAYARILTVVFIQCGSQVPAPVVIALDFRRAWLPLRSGPVAAGCFGVVENDAGLILNFAALFIEPLRLANCAVCSDPCNDEQLIASADVFHSSADDSGKPGELVCDRRS